MFRTTLVVILLAGFAAAQDSPYVALAKRTNRKASKTRVITNETLVRARTYSESTEGEQATTAPAAAAATAQQAAVTEETPAPAPVASVNATTGLLLPPVEQLTEPSYPTTAKTIAPESTARTVPAEMARNIEPTSGAQTIEPQSTIQAVEPASSARNIEPAAAKPPV